jgi:hypothetical protein
VSAGRNKVTELTALADDFADTYRLDKFQRNKLRELLCSLPAMSVMRAAAEPEAKACATCGGGGTEHLQPPAYYPCRPCPSCKAEPEAPIGDANCPRCGEQMGWPTGAEPPTVHDVCEDCETEIKMLAAGWTPPKAEQGCPGAAEPETKAEPSDFDYQCPACGRYIGCDFCAEAEAQR